MRIKIVMANADKVEKSENSNKISLKIIKFSKIQLLRLAEF